MELCHPDSQWGDYGTQLYQNQVTDKPRCKNEVYLFVGMQFFSKLNQIMHLHLVKNYI